MEVGVSVIVCCYNSVERLPETLRHLALQNVPENVLWEIIVIDNASTDETASVAANEWKKYNTANPNFRVLHEPTPGKNYAFKTGVAAARFDFILTCDDDNWLSPNYVANVYEIMQADQLIGALGGCGIFEPQQPANNDVAELTSYYVNGPQQWAKKEHWVYGAGSAYRKSIFTGLIDKGWQQITTGRNGTSLICGEDVEICFMIYLSGFKVIANDGLKFKHFVPLKRQNLNYIVNLSFWLSYTHVLLNSYYPILNNDERPIETIINNWFISATKTYFKNYVFSAFNKNIRRKAETLDEKIAFNKSYGTWYSLFKNRSKIIAHHKQTKALVAAINNNDQLLTNFIAPVNAQ